jgi:hypothetical protein
VPVSKRTLRTVLLSTLIAVGGLAAVTTPAEGSQQSLSCDALHLGGGSPHETGLTLVGDAQCKTSPAAAPQHVHFIGNAQNVRDCRRQLQLTGALTGSFDDGRTAITSEFRISAYLATKATGAATIGLDTGQAGSATVQINYGNIWFWSGDLCDDPGEGGPRGITFDGRFDPNATVAPPLWRAAAEFPTDVEWASVSCADPSRVTQVGDADGQPVRPGPGAYRIAVNDGDASVYDSDPPPGERCELGQANPSRPGAPLFAEGDERWISWKVLLPSSFPMNASLFQGIAQWKQVGGLGTPALAMGVTNGHFTLDSSDSYVSGNGPMISRVVGTAIANQWVRFTLHVKFSPDPAVGFVELYGNLDGSGQQQLVPLTHIWTMKRDQTGATASSHARIGIYRHNDIAGDTYIYYDGYTVAPTKALAESSAFGLEGP